MIKIIGAKVNIDKVEDFLKQIGSFAHNNNVIIQAFDADLVYGKNHLISAYKHAKRAMEQKTNTTNSLEMEILLYASGERQLKLAIPKMGIKKGKTNIAFILINQKTNFLDELANNMLKYFNLTRNDQVLNGDENTLKKFGISETEIKTVMKTKYGHLILEKVAKVDIIK